MSALFIVDDLGWISVQAADRERTPTRVGCLGLTQPASRLRSTNTFILVILGLIKSAGSCVVRCATGRPMGPCASRQRTGSMDGKS